MRNYTALFDDFTNDKYEGLTCFYKGIISQDVILNFAHSVAFRLPEDEIMHRRVFHILIETAQNILHHSAQRTEKDSDNHDTGIGIIEFSETKDHYIISSGNLIENTVGHLVEKRCIFLNSLTKEQLRDYYIKERRNSIVTKKQGGYIGFIDMVRRSGSPLEIHLKAIDNQYSFFMLSVKISKDLSKVYSI
jgi:hypothetical protein